MSSSYEQNEILHHKYIDYGTIPIFSASPSSSEGNQEGACLRAKHRYPKALLFASISVVALLVVLWIPLLQEQPSSSDNVGRTSSKNPPALLYFGAKHIYGKEDDDYIDDLITNSYSYRSDMFSMSRLEGVSTGIGEDSASKTDSFEDQTVIGNLLSIPTNVSFADLAALLLPPYFQKTMDLCVATIIPTTILVEGEGDIPRPVNTTSVLPGEVLLLRKQMLKTRDLLDVFAPVYYKHSDIYNSSSTAEIKDLWKSLRRYLDNGYQLIGDFQDLDHAKIMYTPEQLAEYQVQVWQWYDDFDQFIEVYRDIISLYLSFPCKKGHHNSKYVRCRYMHSHSSHLFWGNTPKEELPDGNKDIASTVLMHLGRSQLERAEYYLRQSLEFDHVITMTSNLTVNDTVHELYHNARKEMRSFIDEVTLFGNLFVPGSSLVPEISSVNMPEVPSPEEEQIDESLLVLKQAKHYLGNINDDYVAFSVYVEWDEFPFEQERLHQSVQLQWESFQVWVEDIQLFAKIQFLVDKMDFRNVGHHSE